MKLTPDSCWRACRAHPVTKSGIRPIEGARRATSALTKSLSNSALETLGIGAFAHCHLVLMVSPNLVQLLYNRRMVRRQTTQTAERNDRLVVFTLHDQPARSLWQEKHAANEDKSPQELKSNGNAIAARIIAIFGCIVDDGGKEKSDGDSQLIGADNGSPDPFRSRFTLVERYLSGDQANAISGEETASNEQRLPISNGLHKHTQIKDDSSRQDKA